MAEQRRRKVLRNNRCCLLFLRVLKSYNLRVEIWILQKKHTATHQLFQAQRWLACTVGGISFAFHLVIPDHLSRLSLEIWTVATTLFCPTSGLLQQMAGTGASCTNPPSLLWVRWISRLSFWFRESHSWRIKHYGLSIPCSTCSRVVLEMLTPGCTSKNL